MTDFAKFFPNGAYDEDSVSSGEDMVAGLLEAESETFGIGNIAVGTDFPLGMDDYYETHQHKDATLSKVDTNGGARLGLGLGLGLDSQDFYPSPQAPIFSLFSSLTEQETSGEGVWNPSGDSVLSSNFARMNIGAKYEQGGDKPAHAFTSQRSSSREGLGLDRPELVLSSADDSRNPNPNPNMTPFMFANTDTYGSPRANPNPNPTSYAVYGDYRGVSAQTHEDGKAFIYRSSSEKLTHTDMIGASLHRTWSSPSSPSGMAPNPNPANAHAGRVRPISSESFASPRSAGQSYPSEQSYSTYDMQNYRHASGIESSGLTPLLPPQGYMSQQQQPSRRHSNAEAMGYATGSHDPLNPHTRSMSLDNVLSQQHYQSHMQTHAAPNIRLHGMGGVPNTHTYDGHAHMASRTLSAVHHMPGTMSPLAPGSPSARQMQLQHMQGAVSSPTVIHSHTVRLQQQQFTTRVASPIASGSANPNVNPNPNSNPNQHVYMVPHMGMRVPTTVMVPGLGLRMVDMMLSSPPMQYNTSMLRPSYEAMLMQNGGHVHGQDRSGRSKEGRRDDSKDMPMESADGYIYQVQFKRAYRNFLLGPSAPRDVTVGDFVKVEADRGEDLGEVIGKVTASSFSEEKFTAGFKGRGYSYHQGESKRIIRLATEDERAQLAVKTLDEDKVLAVCREKVENRALPMKVMDAEYQFDRHKLTFFFEADRRIDFRELVRDLFALYKTRIWLQQVEGSDDVAKGDSDPSGMADAYPDTDTRTQTLTHMQSDETDVDEVTPCEDDKIEA